MKQHEIAQYRRDQQTQKRERSTAKWHHTRTYRMAQSIGRVAYDAKEEFKIGFKKSLGFFGILTIVGLFAPRRKRLCLVAAAALPVLAGAMV